MFLKGIEISETSTEGAYSTFSNIQDWAKHPNLGGYMNPYTGALIVPIQEGEAALARQSLIVYLEDDKIKVRFGDANHSIHMSSFPITPVAIMLLKAKILELTFRDSWKEFLEG